MKQHVSAVRPMVSPRDCLVHQSRRVSSICHGRIRLLCLHPREHTVILMVHIGRPDFAFKVSRRQRLQRDLRSARVVPNTILRQFARFIMEYIPASLVSLSPFLKVFESDIMVIACWGNPRCSEKVEHTICFPSLFGCRATVFGEVLAIFSHRELRGLGSSWMLILRRWTLIAFHRSEGVCNEKEDDEDESACGPAPGSFQSS